MRTLLDDNVFQSSPGAATDGALNPLFILTRFNIAIAGAREKGGGEDEASFRRWCISRSRMFKGICLPSVLAQTQKPRGWLILFDEKYLDETAEALDAVKPYDWIVPIVVKEGDVVSSYRQFYNPVIRAQISESSTFVITSRLDNDDAICRTFVESVCSYAASALVGGSRTSFWISFPFGVQWDGSEVSLMMMNNNPFLSLVEPATLARGDRFRTAMSVNHGQVFNNGEVLTPSSRFPMWLQHTHEENVSNKKNNSLLRFRDPEAALRIFSLGSITG